MTYTLDQLHTMSRIEILDVTDCDIDGDCIKEIYFARLTNGQYIVCRKWNVLGVFESFDEGEEYYDSVN